MSLSDRVRLDKLESEIVSLRAAVDVLVDELAKVQPAKRGPGRPPKNSEKAPN